MKTQPYPRLIETPPASAEAVARLHGAAVAGAHALTLETVDHARRLALELQTLTTLRGLVAPGVPDEASRMADALVAFAARVERVAK